MNYLYSASKNNVHVSDVKPKPKKLPWLIITDADNPVDQSELVANKYM